MLIYFSGWMIVAATKFARKIEVLYFPDYKSRRSLSRSSHKTHHFMPPLLTTKNELTQA